jgi:acetyl-CoA acyltransferase
VQIFQGKLISHNIRLALLKAGFPVEVPGVQLNRMCGIFKLKIKEVVNKQVNLSSYEVHFASQEIASNDMDLTIGCGVEVI